MDGGGFPPAKFRGPTFSLAFPDLGSGESSPGPAPGRPAASSRALAALQRQLQTVALRSSEAARWPGRAGAGAAARGAAQAAASALPTLAWPPCRRSP